MNKNEFEKELLAIEAQFNGTAIEFEDGRDDGDMRANARFCTSNDALRALRGRLARLQLDGYDTEQILKQHRNYEHNLNESLVFNIQALITEYGWAVWFCKPTTPLQSNDKPSKAYKLYRLLAFRFCAWAVQNRHNERT